MIGKAGTGKSTALGAYRAALAAVDIGSSASHHPPLPPINSPCPPASATRDGRPLLVELRHGRRTLPLGVVVVLDEAAMCPHPHPPGPAARSALA
ncbi:MAG TPA: hypothetical protein VK923_02440 [Euzebyales bacterium]|nr:hypothetical protein [Euzebyales bacterium]